MLCDVAPLTPDHPSARSLLVALQLLPDQLRRSPKPLGNQISTRGNGDANDTIGKQYEKR